MKRLVAQLDLPTTTVHRQLSTLTDRGYLVQDPVRKSYRVGPRLLLLSSTVLSHSDLRSTARPELEKLSATVKETINLSVMLDREIFYLDKVETFRSVVCNTKVGTRAPAHATSGGKIMLAFHDPDYVDAYCRDLPQMQRLTDRTVFSPDLLREQLAQAQERLDLLYRLKQKYGGSLEKVLAYQEAAQTEYQGLLSLESTIRNCRKKADALRQELERKAEALTVERKKAGESLCKALLPHIHDLAMPQGRWKSALPNCPTAA